MKIKISPIVDNVFNDKVLVKFSTDIKYSEMVEYTQLFELPLGIFYSEKSLNCAYLQLFEGNEIELEFDLDDVLKKVIQRK